MTQENEQDLRRLNERLIAEENAGNRSFFEERLAPVFVLRRANGEVQGREAFLLSLKAGGERVCDPKSIGLRRLGKTRALVTCVVEIKTRAIHNARLFAKNADGQWQLLAWANELS
jgi:Domain of unknown function (DUF4440)